MKKVLFIALFSALIILPITSIPQETSAQENCLLGFCWGGNTVGDEPGDFGRYDDDSDFTSGNNRVNLDTAPTIIISLGYFLNNVLIPFLFAVALLIFLVNAARYFIIDGASEESRKKARSLALYGIAAFVFLVSLWGIVNTLVDGLGIDTEDSMCPDYLNEWCGNKGYSDTRTGFDLLDTDDETLDDPTIVNPDDNPGTPSVDDLPSAIAELVFGDLTDAAAVSFVNGAPRATGQTVSISDNTACTSALTTLALASDIETNQSAYLLYEQNGSYQWKNITDSTFENGVVYDGDTLTELVNAGAEDIHIVHTHQKQNTEDAGLISNGYGPSTADMNKMCDTALLNTTHVIVDWNNVWIMTQPTGTCPRRSSQTDNFPVIEAMYLLAETDTESRQQEYIDLINAAFVPNDYETIFRGWQSEDFASMSNVGVRSLVNSLENESNVSIEKTSHIGFCSNL